MTEINFEIGHLEEIKMLFTIPMNIGSDEYLEEISVHKIIEHWER